MAVKQPQIQRIDRANVAAIIQAIIEDGCCIIKNFTDVETIKKVNAEAKPYLDADKPWKASYALIDPVSYVAVLTVYRETFFHRKLAAART